MMNFYDFFSKIPSVPLRNICKNMKTEQVIPLFFYSPHWKDAIKCYQSQEKGSLKLIITDKDIKIELESWVVPTGGYCVRDDIKHFQIQFFEDTDNSDIDFSAEIIKITAACIEPMAHEFIRPLFSMFSSLEFYDLSLKLSEKSPDSTVRFLLSLPCYLLLNLTLEWPKQTIDFRRLRVLLRSIMFTRSLNMSFEFDKPEEQFEFEPEKGMLEVKMKDASCFPGHFFEKIDCIKGKIGHNHMTSANFNKWFRSWKEGKIGHRTEQLTFVISDNRNIKMEDVMEGLDAEKWDPLVRDKTFIRSDSDSLEEFTPQYVLIMDDAMDITNVHGRLGSVKISKNELNFIVWWWSGCGFEERFPTKKQLESLEGWLEHYEEELKEKAETRNRLMALMEGDPISEEVKVELEKVEEEIRKIEGNLEEVKGQLVKFRNEYV